MRPAQEKQRSSVAPRGNNKAPRHWPPGAQLDRSSALPRFACWAARRGSTLHLRAHTHTRTNCAAIKRAICAAEREKCCARLSATMCSLKIHCHFRRFSFGRPAAARSPSSRKSTFYMQPPPARAILDSERAKWADCGAGGRPNESNFCVV